MAVVDNGVDARNQAYNRLLRSRFNTHSGPVQLVVQDWSFSGLRTDHNCLIRSSMMSKATTTMAVPPW
jgi:hypothetical protein